MSKSLNRYNIRKQSISRINKLFEHPQNVNVIHYSCENFDNTPQGNSPRITSIAVRNLLHEQATSFSIHKTAEKEGIENRDIDQNYNKLEKQMLDEFYEFVKSCNEFDWIHWNMRDEKYGFPAIDRRYEVLGGNPIKISDSRKHSLSGIFIDIYGEGYIDHERLTKLYQLNTRSEKRTFLTGVEEADAFEKRDFLSLHNSTLKKVDVIAGFAKAEYTGELKTTASLIGRYGTNIQAYFDLILESCLYKGLSILAIIFSIIEIFCN